MPPDQDQIIRRLQRRLTETERELVRQRQRADYASARADGLEEQHARLLEAIPALNCYLSSASPHGLLRRIRRFLKNV